TLSATANPTLRILLNLPRRPHTIHNRGAKESRTDRVFGGRLRLGKDMARPAFFRALLEVR
ncbi:hypothetical protein, partial [Bradyrhizobium ottawaense]|uniref:hypothetical protein n=1 Tax=Bradyrhizobium ottawaense TaxID=931866 RepID=UPI0030C671B7